MFFAGRCALHSLPPHIINMFSQFTNYYLLHHYYVMTIYCLDFIELYILSLQFGRMWHLCKKQCVETRQRQCKRKSDKEYTFIALCLSCTPLKYPIIDLARMVLLWSFGCFKLIFCAKIMYRNYVSFRIGVLLFFCVVVAIAVITSQLTP